MTNIMTWNPMPTNGVGIRMSACGHAFVPAARIATPMTGAFMGATYVAPATVQGKGHVSLLVDGDVRAERRTQGAEATGTDAWRPPST